MSRSDDDMPPICGTFTGAGGEWINHAGTPVKQPIRAARSACGTYGTRGIHGGSGGRG